MIHTMEMRVPWHDTDSANIVHHANYFHWMEQAEIELFRKSGKSRREICEASKIQLLRLPVKCDHYAPVFDDDVLEIQTEVLHLKEKTFTLRHKVQRITDDKHIATGELVICCAKPGENGNIQSHPLPKTIVSELKKYMVVEKSS